jgi:hypothetical protein
VRRILSLLTLVLASSIALAAAQSTPPAASEDRLIGNWTGTFDGTASGKYTMAFSRDDSKKLAGKVEAMPDGGDGYIATFKSIIVGASTVTIAYDSPDGGGGEVQLEATVDGKSLKGTWKSLDPSKNVVQIGTFSGTKG